MGDLRKSKSKGDIDDLLSDIRDIVNDNAHTLDDLKKIQDHNEQISHHLKIVDVPSAIGGNGRCELNIPHKRDKSGESRAEINRRSKREKLPEINVRNQHEPELQIEPFKGDEVYPSKEPTVSDKGCGPITDDELDESFDGVLGLMDEDSRYPFSDEDDKTANPEDTPDNPVDDDTENPGEDPVNSEDIAANSGAEKPYSPKTEDELQIFPKPGYVSNTDDNVSQLELKEEDYVSSEYESSDEVDEPKSMVILEYDGKLAVGTQLAVETEKHRPVESSPPAGETVIKSVPNTDPDIIPVHIPETQVHPQVHTTPRGSPAHDPRGGTDYEWTERTTERTAISRRERSTDRRRRMAAIRRRTDDRKRDRSKSPEHDPHDQHDPRDTRDDVKRGRDRRPQHETTRRKYHERESTKEPEEVPDRNNTEPWWKSVEIPRERHPSGNSEVYRIRKDSAGSVEVYPGYVEEQHVLSSSCADSSGEDTYAKRSASQPRTLTEKTSVLRRLMEITNMHETTHTHHAHETAQTHHAHETASTHHAHTHHEHKSSDTAKSTLHSRSWADNYEMEGTKGSSTKRRIIVEKCPHCELEAGDSPAEIEIRICRRSERCRSLRSLRESREDIRSPDREPHPPNRSSSLGRIPQHHHHVNRAPSPSEREIERLTKRLDILKRELTTVIGDYEDENVSRSGLSDRPYSPYHPDKTSYYRARYHSAPHSPTGQSDQTTSTTDMPQVYHPAREERSRDHPMQSYPEESPREDRRVVHLSTQSLELPVEDRDEIEYVTKLRDRTDPFQPENHFIPLQNNNRNSFYDNDDSDIGSSRPEYSYPLKREEQMLTPPPLPPRGDQQGDITPPPRGDQQGDITLRGDNLYDPYHIGTTYVVLSRQNHGRFAFSTPPDPNSSVPGSPMSARRRSPARSGSPARSSPKQDSSRTSDSPNTRRSNSPLIQPIRIEPVSSTPPPSSVPTSKRSLYQPKSLNGSMISLSSPTSPELVPPFAARTTADWRKKFNRPEKEPIWHENAVDAPVDVPALVPAARKQSLQDIRNPAAREFHLKTIHDVEAPVPRTDTWSGAPPPAPRASSPHPPFSPHGQTSLRSQMPHVKLLGDEWKELAQRLGYENSQIGSFVRDFPDPGQALLDHWSQQPDSRLDDLLKQLKNMDLWKQADTLDKTFDTTHV